MKVQAAAPSPLGNSCEAAQSTHCHVRKASSSEVRRKSKHCSRASDYTLSERCSVGNLSLWSKSPRGPVELTACVLLPRTHREAGKGCEGGKDQKAVVRVPDDGAQIQRPAAAVIQPQWVARCIGPEEKARAARAQL